MQLILSILQQVKIMVPKGKISVDKHSFCYLNLQNIKQKKCSVSPANNSLLDIS